MTLVLVVQSDVLGEGHVDQHDGEGEILSLAPAFTNRHSLLRKCSERCSEKCSLLHHVLLSPPQGSKSGLNDS